MSVSLTPWFGSVTGGAANTPESVQSLLLALAASVKPNIGPSNILRCAYLSIQADPLGAGAKYYIGRSDMSATDFGYYLTAGLIWNPPSSHANLYRLDQIYLLSDTSSSKWSISFITK